MSSILPFRSEVEVAREAPRVIDLEGEESEAIFNALASDTSRSIYRELYSGAATASDIADSVDTSVQNVRYHLEKLEDAGLIDQVDTWYSSRGNEMAVYAAMDEALIVAGDQHRRSELQALIHSLVGGVAVLAAISLAMHFFVLDYLTGPAVGGEPQRHLASGDYPAPQSIGTATQDPSQAEVLIGGVLGVSPSLLVFIGGLGVLLGLGAVMYVRHRSLYRD